MPPARIRRTLASAARAHRTPRGSTFTASLYSSCRSRTTRRRTSWVLPVLERMAKLEVRFPTMKTPIAIEALAHLGRHRRGLGLPAIDSRERRGAQTAPGRSASVQHCRGLLAAAADDLQEAEALLAAAAERSRELGLPFEHGRSLLALGTVRRRLQQKLAARETLEEARLVLRPSRSAHLDRARRSRAAADRRTAQPRRIGTLRDRVANRGPGQQRPHEQRSRRGAADQPQDRRVEPVEDLPQARRPVAYRARGARDRVNQGISPGDPRAGAA